MLRRSLSYAAWSYRDTRKSRETQKASSWLESFFLYRIFLTPPAKFLKVFSRNFEHKSRIDRTAPGMICCCNPSVKSGIGCARTEA